MVTWGNNTTAVYGTTTPANAPTTPAPAGSGFSFGAPAAPSTPPSASQKPAVNPPPLGGGFGAPAAGGGFSFGGGAAPAPAGGLFGSTAAPAPSGGLFGSTTPAPAPTAGGLFGSTPAPAPAFGNTAAPAPSLFGGFGAPAPSNNVFGSTQQQPQQQYNTQQAYNPQQAALHAHQSASQRQEAARIEEAIFNLHSKYSPHASDPLNPALASNNIPSSLCAFTAILYDPLPPEHRINNTTASAVGSRGGGGHLSAPKPSHISNQVWNEALARNPDPNELMPTPLVGSTSLHSRIISQQEKANALNAHATKLRDTLCFLQQTARSSQEHITHLANTQEELNRRLLEIMRKVEIIRCMNQPTQRAEEEANFKLRKLLEQVNLVAVRLRDLEERGRQQARNWRMRGATQLQQQRNNGGVDGTTALSEEDKLALFHVLNDQRLGMERLGSIVTRDVRDTDILKEEMNKAESVVRGGSGGRRVGGALGQSPAIFGGR
uniref:Nucleoporin Nup54 alpha-helical domain-containing protein n=1 Tax=Skeletonema marinoi TaxID=267567 RepID=A0A7S2M2R6_9STRA|mmetsp:Transcript_33277/g.56402  ORF Transcript_33277/g.56402 Transcript_33277/m.56402 type:complete len:491 (+) Transcript_33277:92-1564(+)